MSVDNNEIVKYAVIFFLLLAVFVFVTVLRMSKNTTTDTFNDIQQLSAPSPQKEEESVQLVVHVAGAVRSPGVYKLPGNSRVVDAIKAAKGLLLNADVRDINFAQPLKDGQKIYFALKTTASMVADSANKTVNINSADKNTLDGLPGIGPSTADKIIEFRKLNGSFSSLEDLKQIRGMSDNKIAKLKPYISVY